MNTKDEAASVNETVEDVDPLSAQNDGLVLNKLVCPKCYRVCKNENTLKFHIRKCGTEPYGCPYCNFRRKRASCVLQHVFFKHPGNEIRYEVIPQTSKSTDDTVVQFPCATCYKDFGTRETLVQHLQSECGQKEATFRCTYCGVICSKDSMYIHARDVHPDRVFSYFKV